MARLKLTIHDVSFFDSATASDPTIGDLSVSTEKETATTFFQVGDNKYNYALTLVNFSFKKKMYQPTEIMATIQISMASGKSADWKSIDRKTLISLFRFKKITLEEVSDKDALIQTIGNDYYVQEVKPNYTKESLTMLLEIYSLDKKMTLHQACRNYVGKKLVKDILATEVKTYTLPYDDKTNLGYNDNLKHLTFERIENNIAKTYEHTFPYLVQYNESFYNMLARTANRWGEFLYYENGKLNIGYDAKNNAKIGSFSTISYLDLDANLQDIADQGKFDCVAADEKGLLDSTVKKSPNEIKGLLFSPGSDGDKVAMKKIASFLKNDKDLPTFIFGQLFDDTLAFAQKKISVAYDNDEFDSKYFTDTDKNNSPEKYGTYDFGNKDNPDNADGHNLFSEINSEYGGAKYLGILNKELAAAKNAVCIDFDVTCPQLKLGNIIEYNGEKFIVVEISSKYKLTDSYSIADEDLKKAVAEQKGAAVTKTTTTALVFQVVATAINSDGIFYPTVIPEGHVRFADPQMATVDDDDDPSGNGRVRVKFDWHGKDDDATPWIQFTANASGQKGIMGKHYKDDKVLVGYVNGNVERPYVLGAISKGASSDVQCVTPGGHQLKIEDDASGLSSFLTGMFLPGWGTIAGFVPQMGALDHSMIKNSPALGGGFELSDKYGIYKISGSTDGRNVTVASPWGDVAINAFTGITISAPNGDISIKGKNVSIEAGNNLSLTSGTNVKYKLLKTKDTFGGTMAQLATDIPVLVAKKLAEMALNIVDLSILRSVVDIVMRPVEGCLTVKSNRFLKLEAGKNECDYPHTAYKASEEEQKKVLDAKAKKAILAGTGKFLGVSRGMVGLFESIDQIVDDLDTKYENQYNLCVSYKAALKGRIKDLEPWRNDATKPVCTKDFDALYNDLKADLWAVKDKFEPFDEAKLSFDNENIKADKTNVTDSVSSECHNAHYNDYFFKHPLAGGFLKNSIEAIDAKIVQERLDLRKAALDALNRLGKAIWELQHIELKKTDVGQGRLNLSWFAFTPVPADFKTKMVAAFSRANCPNCIYYKPVDDENRKKLDALIPTNNFAFDDKNKKYMKRLVAMNLLKELGFEDGWRKKISNAADAVVPPQPATDSLADTEGNIMHSTTWKNYVASLSGIPAFKKDKTALGSALEKVGKDALDNLWPFTGISENFSYSDGSNGQILIGTDKSTYLLNKEGVKEAPVLETTVKSLNDIAGAEDGLDAKQKSSVQGFVEQIREALNKL
jgi:hypothetical protein